MMREGGELSYLEQVICHTALPMLYEVGSLQQHECASAAALSRGNCCAEVRQHAPTACYNAATHSVCRLLSRRTVPSFLKS